MEQRFITPGLSVGPQIAVSDVATLSQQGFTDIVCNRPDSEHDGPSSSLLAAQAKSFGLRFHYLPIQPGAPVDDQARRLASLTAQPGNRVFAYCRSGARAQAAFQAARPAL